MLWPTSCEPADSSDEVSWAQAGAALKAAAMASAPASAKSFVILSSTSKS
jgi:hypothetical protein